LKSPSQSGFGILLILRRPPRAAVSKDGLRRAKFQNLLKGDPYCTS
jgi:hypothetical protein